MQTNNLRASGLLQASAKGLGALVWWSLSNSRITPSAMRSILAAEGLDTSVVPDIEALPAVKRAVREWTQGRGNASRYRAEVASEAADGLVIGVLKREQVGRKEVAWTQVDSVAFDGTGWVSQGASPEATALCGHIDEVRSHLDHQWIRPAIILKGLEACHAVCLRDRGGVYFVAEQFEANLQQLSRIVAAIGGSHLDIVHAQATPESQASIAGGARAAMSETLSTLVEKISGWTSDARKRRVRSTCATTVLAELAGLQAQAHLYELALQVSMADLTEAISAAKAEAVTIIDGHNIELPNEADVDEGPPPSPIDLIESKSDEELREAYHAITGISPGDIGRSAIVEVINALN